MENETFQAVVRPMQGVALIKLSGEINSFAEGPLEAAYEDAERIDVSQILLDFNQVDYINSTGIALIVNLLSKSREAGKQLSVFGLTEHYQEIFRITRLTEFIQVYPDQKSALEGAMQNSSSG